MDSVALRCPMYWQMRWYWLVTLLVPVLLHWSLSHQDAYILKRNASVLSLHSGSMFQSIYCSAQIVGGGNIYSNGFFFVQTIFADRYIHCREIILVSLKSSSSVELEIQIFLNFVFFSRSYRGLKFCVNTIFGMILFTFRGLFVQIKNFLQK